MVLLPPAGTAVQLPKDPPSPQLATDQVSSGRLCLLPVLTLQSSTSAKIEGQKKAPEKPTVRASASTQPEEQASGKTPVHSRGNLLPQPAGGRTTRTAKKAARPITPSNSPPTHPAQVTPSPQVTIPGIQPSNGLSTPEPPFLHHQSVELLLTRLWHNLLISAFFRDLKRCL